MSLWLQAEMKKLEEHRANGAPKAKHILITVIVVAILEGIILIAGQSAPDYNPIPLCLFVGLLGFVIVLMYAITSKTKPNKAKLPVATKSIENLNFSSQELQQFDSEMMTTPLAVIKNNNRADLPITITEHYMTEAFYGAGEIDYNIVRLSDIAMTCYASSKSASTANPLDKVFDIDLLDAQGNKVSGVTIDGKKAFLEFNAALEKYASHIQLNVPIKEVKNIRKNSK